MVKEKKEKITDREMEYYIKGIETGIQVCLKKITDLDRSLTIQVALNKEKNKEKVNENE